MRAVLILALVLSAAQAQSQLGTGALSGVVQDSSNAVITGADITLTNMETGLVRHMISGSGGQFFAPVLPPGGYKLLVSKPGFAALEQSTSWSMSAAPRLSPPPCGWARWRRRSKWKASP